MKVRVITRKNKLPNLSKMMAKIQKASSEYGYFEDQGVHYSGLPFATLMYIHENGSSTGIPARKPFRIALFNGQKQLLKFTLKSLNQHVMSVTRGGFVPLENTLNTFGAYGVEMTQKLFGSSALIPNREPVFKRSKRTDNSPLVDFGDLRDEMTHRIYKK